MVDTGLSGLGVSDMIFRNRGTFSGVFRVYIQQWDDYDRSDR